MTKNVHGTQTVYLDNNATTRVDPAVVQAMLPWFTEHYANPSSLHRGGRIAAMALGEARRNVQALLGAEHESEIVFTSGGSEANTTAILAATRSWPERREILTTAVEHPAVLGVCEQLEREGYTVHRIAVDHRGRLDLQDYAWRLSDRVALVSAMWANNETGTLFPVVAMAEMAQAAGVPFHTDAVQAVGKIPVALRQTAITMLSLSGHKLHGPKGVGALYVRRGSHFQPLLRGGSQERGRRAGTENLAGIVGLGRAAELVLADLPEAARRMAGLRDRLQAGILANVPGARVTGDVRQRLPNTLNVTFDAVEGEAVVLLLDQAGIAVSNGSACASGALESSHVLRAMGLPAGSASGSVRFSLSRLTTATEIEKVLLVLPPIVARLRGLASTAHFAAPVREAPRDEEPAHDWQPGGRRAKELAHG